MDAIGATRISAEKREFARGIWNEAFQRYGVDPASAGKPFLQRWKTVGDGLSDELSVAADVLWAIGNSLTEKSSPVFHDKVRRLVLATSEGDYQRLLSELAVAALFASRASPIACEPFVPLSANPARKPKSCDYSFCLPDSAGELVEATTIDLSEADSDEETVLKRLKRTLRHKRSQSFPGKPYVLALRVFGYIQATRLAKRVIESRIWPNLQFRRYAGVFLVAQESEPGAFAAAWLPNPRTVKACSVAFADIVSGGRCYHLHTVKNLQVGQKELMSFRESVDTPREPGRLFIPVLLLGGPLDGLRVYLDPPEVGATQISYTWELTDKTATCGRFRLRIPPHGPIQVAYGRVSDTVYRFAGFRFWINELRPKEGSFLLTLKML